MKLQEKGVTLASSDLVVFNLLVQNPFYQKSISPTNGSIRRDINVYIKKMKARQLWGKLGESLLCTSITTEPQRVLKHNLKNYRSSDASVLRAFTTAAESQA